jgi:uncharacterized protein (DUF1800 family)
MDRLRKLLEVAALVGVLAFWAMPAGADAAQPLPSVPAPATSGSPIALPASPLTPDQAILHVLDRLGYGPRPGDLERVRQIGVAQYIHRQLAPARIADEGAARALAAYPAITKSAAELINEYPRPALEDVRMREAGEMTAVAFAEKYPLERRPVRVIEAMQAAKVTRAVMSERQLEEVMVDFWFNHFNVFSQKGPVQWMVPAYEREAIRPHALGHFRDLVLATARHPAMLYYLDNWLSTRDDFVAQTGRFKGTKRGINENYARELMELHTLGVDGGYTQKDVTEVARCFTGWSIDRPDLGGAFLFRRRTHDQGTKVVLGKLIPSGGGIEDGERVIDILVRHPSTAHFIATKLVRRFVSDDPPAALVDRVAMVFRGTDGDIRAMLAAIFTSPEFFSTESYHAKIKTPLEAVVSAVRAVDARIEPPGASAEDSSGGALVLARRIGRLGSPLYQAQPPTGYADRAEAWVNSGALLGRMNFALALTENRLPAVRVDVERTISGVDRSRPSQVLDRLLSALLYNDVSPATRAVLTRELGSPEITRATLDDREARNMDVEKLMALVLGSPEFQRR